MSSLLYQNQNINDLKRVNDSMSEKIKQNQKQKVPFINNMGSNITSGVETEKRIINNNNNLEESNNINNNISGSLGRNVSQSSLSVDLSRFKINPNNFNNLKNKLKLNQNENFETFNPENNNYISINNSNENIDLNNFNNLNNLNNLNNDNNVNIINEKKIEEKKNNMNSLLKNFNPYDIKTYLGDKAPSKTIKKKNLNFINNIPPSTSNLQMILYNKKIEEYNKKNNPDYIFKEFYQKESRRMLVEYLKIYKDENMSLKNFMKNENINPLVLLLKEKDDEQNSINNKSNINDENINISYLNKDASNKSFLNSETANKRDLLSNNPSKRKLKNVDSFKILSAFLNDVNDEAQEKSLLLFLSIPRILSLISSGEKLSYLFCSSPTNISCIYGIETYIFKWNDCKNYNLIGYFDLINVDNCYINPGNKKRFDIYISLGKKNNKENNKVNEESYYCIEASQEEIAQNYVQAINFVSQLIKYRVYLKQKKEGKLTKYNYIFN